MPRARQHAVYWTHSESCTVNFFFAAAALVCALCAVAVAKEKPSRIEKLSQPGGRA